jgi:hypothetical protein
MINKYMNENAETQQKPEESEKPNEFGGFYFSSSIKIFDPESKEILVQKRGDD